MSKLYSRVLPASRIRLHALAAALALATLASTQAQAARLGSARVLSAQGSTLNVTATYTQLTPEEASTLKVTLADADAWTRAGLTPPTTLASMRVQLEPPVGRAQAASARVIRVTSSEPSSAQTVDLLFDVSTSSGQRQVQLSVLAPQPGLSRPAAPTPAFVPKAQPRSDPAPAPQALTVETPSPAAPSADAGARGTVVVQRNQNLSGIAQRYPVADASYYQELVALWQANPSAFIEDNMNLVREGERLTIPSAAAVRAVDPAQAQRLYNEHLEAHALYRSRMAGSVVGGRAVAGGPTASGEVGAGSAPVTAGVQTAQDRLRLSSAQGDGSTGAGSASAGDQRSSEALALKDANDRVNQLQRNVDDLKSAANATAGGAVIGGANGGTATGAVGASGAPGSSGPAGGSGAAGAAGAAGSDGSAGASGATGAAGATGATGASGLPGASGAPGGSGSSGSGATLGGLAGGGVSGAAANSASSGKSGTSNNTSGGASSSDSTSSPGASSPGTSGTPSLMSQSGLPAWLTDNLLIVVTGILAIIAFIIAWVVRRAAARRDDDSDNDNDSGDDEPSDRTVDPGLIDKRLGEIDLDLNNPPNDGEPFDNRRA